MSTHPPARTSRYCQQAEEIKFSFFLEETDIFFYLLQYSIDNEYDFFLIFKHVDLIKEWKVLSNKWKKSLFNLKLVEKF